MDMHLDNIQSEDVLKFLDYVKNNLGQDTLGGEIVKRYELRKALDQYNEQYKTTQKINRLKRIASATKWLGRFRNVSRLVSSDSELLTFVLSKQFYQIVALIVLLIRGSIYIYICILELLTSLLN